MKTGRINLLLFSDLHFIIIGHYPLNNEYFQKKKRNPKTIYGAKILRQRGVVVPMFGIKSEGSPLIGPPPQPTLPVNETHGEEARSRIFQQ